MRLSGREGSAFVVLDFNMLLVGTFFIFVLAGIAQATTGFGSALVAVPLIALQTEPSTAVVAVTVAGVVLVALASFTQREHVVRPVAVRLSIAGFIGLPAGLAALTWLSADLLTVIIGVTLLAVVSSIFFGLRISHTTSAQWAAGVVSGSLLSSTGMNGPPLVLILQAMQVSTRQFRATLQVVFLLQEIAALVGFIILGQVDRLVLTMALVGIPAMPLGWWLGDRIFARISPGLLRRLVLVGLLAAAAVSILRVAL